jgi:hypothetical protein
LKGKSNDCKKKQTIVGAIEREGVNKQGKGKQEKCPDKVKGQTAGVTEKQCMGDIPTGQIDSRRNDFFYKRKGKVNA